MWHHVVQGRGFDSFVHKSSRKHPHTFFITRAHSPPECRAIRLNQSVPCFLNTLCHAGEPESFSKAHSYQPRGLQAMFASWGSASYFAVTGNPQREQRIASPAAGEHPGIRGTRPLHPSSGQEKAGLPTGTDWRQIKTIAGRAANALVGPAA